MALLEDVRVLNPGGDAEDVLRAAVARCIEDVGLGTASVRFSPRDLGKGESESGDRGYGVGVNAELIVKPLWPDKMGSHSCVVSSPIQLVRVYAAPSVKALSESEHFVKA